jgi:hypothetical protein
MMPYSSTMDARRWRLNGEPLARSEVARWLSDRLRTAAIRSTGGLLFLFCCDGHDADLTVAPWIEGGVRNRHYDMQVSCDERFILIGSITASGDLSVLFRNAAVDAIARTRYRDEYTVLAALLLDSTSGRDGRAAASDLRLDNVSARLLVDSDILESPPSSLKDLLARCASRP